MMFKATFVFAVAAICGAAIAAEVHGGITFEVQWTNTTSPLDEAIKDHYESSAAQQATARLQAAIAEKGIASDCVSANSTPAGLYAFKDCITGENPDNFFDLLSDDIAQGNTFWESVIANSTTDRTQWVPARAYVTAYFGTSLSALNFALWSQSSFAVAEDLHSNPEHYFFNETATSSSNMVSDIFEGWGGVLSSFGTIRTNFTVPTYTEPNFGSADQPEEWSISSDFPLLFQRIGPKVLTYGDNSTFGMLHIAVRDVPATNSTPAAIEIYSAVWYPPFDKASPENHTEFTTNYVQDEAHHMVVEIINDSLKAKEDCSTGLCVL